MRSICLLVERLLVKGVLYFKWQESNLQVVLSKSNLLKIYNNSYNPACNFDIYLYVNSASFKGSLRASVSRCDY